MADDAVQLKFGADIAAVSSAMKSMQDNVVSSLGQIGQTLQNISSQFEKFSQDAKEHNKKVESSFQALQSSVTGIFSGITGVFSSFSSNFKMLMGVLAGGSVFKEFLDSALNLSRDVKDLSMYFGITTGAASNLRTALKLAGISTDEYTNMARNLMRQLGKNEEGMKSMGLVTRDSSYNLRNLNDLTLEATQIVSKYAAGSDRSWAARQMFSKAEKDVGDIIKLNSNLLSRATELTQKLGLTMGVDGISHSAGYKRALAELKIEFEAVSVSVGEALLPYFEKMAKWLSEEGLSVITTFRRAMETLHIVVSDPQAWDSLIKEMQSIGTFIVVLIQNILTALKSLFSGAAAALAGDFTKAAQIMNEASLTIEGRWDVALANMERKSASFWGRLKAAWNQAAQSITMPQPGTDKVAGPEGTRRAPPALGGGAGKAEDVVRQWEQALQRIKDSQADLNAWTTAQDYVFWNEKLAQTQKGSDQWWAIWHKMAELWRGLSSQQQAELAKQAKDADEVRNIDLKAEQKHAEAMYALKLEDLNTKRQLGVISAQEELVQQRALLEQKYQNEMAALQERLALQNMEPKERAKINAELKALEDKHALEMKRVNDQMAIESQSRWQQMLAPVTSAFKSAISGLITGTMTLKDAMKSAITGIVNAISNAALDMVGKWLWSHGVMKAISWLFKTQEVSSTVTTEAAKAAAVAAGVQAQVAAKTAGAAEGKAVEVTSGLSSIMKNAYKAASGAYAAVAEIPIIGPILAPISAAVAFAAVAAFGGGMSSAAGGWDEVPSDQMAMLHKKEMVLSAGLAERVRFLSDPLGMMRSALQELIASVGPLFFAAPRLDIGGWSIPSDRLTFLSGLSSGESFSAPGRFGQASGAPAHDSLYAGGSRGGDLHIHLDGVIDSRDLMGRLQDNRSDLCKTLSKWHRDGHLKLPKGGR